MACWAARPAKAAGPGEGIQGQLSQALGEISWVEPRPSGEQPTPGPGTCQAQPMTTGELSWLEFNEAAMSCYTVNPNLIHIRVYSVRQKRSQTHVSSSKMAPGLAKMNLEASWRTHLVECAAPAEVQRTGGKARLPPWA